jgi:hypothetical protein
VLATEHLWENMEMDEINRIKRTRFNSVVMIDEKTQKFLFSFLGEIHLLLLGLGEG